MHRFGVPRSTLPALAAAALMATAVLGLAAILAPPAVAAPFTSPDGLWTWSRPLPHGYPASSISAPAPGVLFVATTTSDALATSDGGASWTWSRTGGVAGFTGAEGVQFVSTSDGWAWGADATGKNGVVLRTTDGGATWQSSLTIPGLPSLSVSFADPSTGWLVAGEDFSEFSGYDVLSSTTDGGQTWSVPVALPQDNGLATFTALAPQGGDSAVLVQNLWSRDAGIGDVTATEVWRTTDGGATWLAPTTLKGADLGDAAFSSPTDGWATGVSWLWHTTDGGASWHKVRRIPTSMNGQVTTVGDDVWVVTPGGALHSPDGGATWQTLPGLSGWAVSFSDPLNGWIASYTDYLHTTDGGKTWHHLTTAPQPGVTKLAAGAGATVWGTAGRVIKSTDGGLRWRNTTKRDVSAVAAVSATRAWAVGRKGLAIHTTDGGHHWTVQPTGVVVALNCVFFADAGHGWAGGNNGTLLRTVDGGRHWAHKRSASGADISQLDFADARHGIALAGSGILSTRDGGRTWTTTRLPDSQDEPTAMTMQDASHALIVAYDRVGIDPQPCFTTTDGGKTWQRGGSIANRDVYRGIAQSGSQLCAVGEFGNVVTSRDGGTTWTYDGAPFGILVGVLTSAQFVGADTLVIGGDLGILTRDLTTAPLP